MKALWSLTLLIMIISAGCAPLAPISAAQIQATATHGLIPTRTPLLPNTAVPSPVFTPSATPDLRLPPEDWMNWPVVPETTDRVYEIYQRGIELENDPHHFSKIEDCHNVKEAFMGLFYKPG
jgi:hypothetical protein